MPGPTGLEVDPPLGDWFPNSPARRSSLFLEDPSVPGSNSNVSAPISTGNLQIFPPPRVMPWDPQNRQILQNMVEEADLKRLIQSADLNFRIKFTGPGATPDGFLPINSPEMVDFLRNYVNAMKGADAIRNAKSDAAHFGISISAGAAYQGVIHNSLRKLKDPGTTTEHDYVIPVQVTQELHPKDESGFEVTFGIQGQKQSDAPKGTSNIQLQASSGFQYTLQLPGGFQITWQLVQLAGSKVWSSSGGSNDTDTQINVQSAVAVQWQAGPVVFQLQGSVGLTNQKGDNGGRTTTLDEGAQVGIMFQWRPKFLNP